MMSMCLGRCVTVYDIQIHREALKVYRKLDKELQVRIDEAIEKLRLNPWRRDLDIKKLHGEYKGYYRLRVGEVRVVYAVAHRGSAYK